MLPALLFIGLNLLLSVANVAQPYEAAAAVGARIMSFQTFNLVSPVVFLGGASAALLAIAPTLFRLRGKKDGSTLSITGMEVKAELAGIALVTVAIGTIATLVGYEALEWFFTKLH